MRVGNKSTRIRQLGRRKNIAGNFRGSDGLIEFLRSPFN